MIALSPSLGLLLLLCNMRPGVTRFHRREIGETEGVMTVIGAVAVSRYMRK
jgi:hypothetical protein